MSFSSTKFTILAYQQVIRRMPVADNVVDYAVNLAASTRPGREIGSRRRRPPYRPASGLPSRRRTRADHTDFFRSPYNSRGVIDSRHASKLTSL